MIVTEIDGRARLRRGTLGLFSHRGSVPTDETIATPGRLHDGSEFVAPVTVRAREAAVVPNKLFALAPVRRGEGDGGEREARP
jgi:hypothetical protein